VRRATAYDLPAWARFSLRLLRCVLLSLKGWGNVRETGCNAFRGCWWTMVKGIIIETIPQHTLEAHQDESLVGVIGE